MTAAPPPGADLRLGIDVGGTFTDIVVSWPGGAVRSKVPSTPDDPSSGVLAACTEAAAMLGWSRSELLGQLERFGLGTTVVTNVLATESGRRLGLLTTAGFEDLIPLARGHRSGHNGWLVPPQPLVPRERIVGVAERCDRDGDVSRRVDDAEVVAAVERLVADEGIESLVVSFLWSFRNPHNEEAAARAVAGRFPDLPVTIGSVVAPVIREFERTQLALLNAYVGGVLDWLGPLEITLREEGLRTGILLMHSNGGAVTLPHAVAAPIGLAQSGPAAGAAAATRLVRAMGDGGAVTCDMGGTSLDVALITGGEALRKNRGELVGQWTAMSMVDVDSVGSGGGSIAWADALGGLRVGPESAGADPGPACYGRGGDRPTVTDALLLLGYIDPHRFLGGRMPLDTAAAEATCRELGRTLGLDAHDVAWGIREIALARMTKAVRGRLATRGLAAADLGVVAFGGCGPLFGADIAHQIGAARCVVPALASVFSAHGAATGAVRRERSRSVVCVLPTADDVLQETFRTLRQAVLADLGADGVDPSVAQVRLEADVRFERQGWEFAVPLDGPPETVTSEAVVDGFRRAYAARYGEGALSTGVKIELVTARATGVADDPRRPGAADDVGAGPPVVPATTRPVVLRRGSPPVEVGVVDWRDLPGRWLVEGPALLEAGDTSVWIPPDSRAVPLPDDAIEIVRTP